MKKDTLKKQSQKSSLLQNHPQVPSMMQDIFIVSSRYVKSFTAVMYFCSLVHIFRKLLIYEIEVSLILITIFSSLLTLHVFKRNFKLPPGPSGFPLLGIIPFIKKEFHLTLFDFSRAFGDIVSFRMGCETVVVLSDYRTIKKAFQSKDFTFRPKNPLSQMLGGYGIVNSDGDLWKSQRRYLLRQKLGMKFWERGMNALESTVQTEAVNMMEILQTEHIGQPVNPSSIINCAVSNVICSMIMTKRFHHRDPQFSRFMQLFDEGFRLFTLTSSLVFIPILKHLPGISRACRQLRANREEMLGFVRGVIKDHKENIDFDNPRDLVDAYLVEIAKIERGEIPDDDKSNMFHGFDPDTQVAQIVLDLFSAGVETLKTSLLWAIVYMLHNPNVMKKVQDELDSVVSSNDLPSLANIHDLPYTRATMYEIMRRSSVVPMGTTHATDNQDVEFEGYRIPKNAHVIPLLHAVHMNPDTWDEPEEFRPERFLSPDGTKVIKPEHFMPFGVGQRMCLGDNLAEKELFLFFSTLMQHFDMENPKGAPLPNLKGVAGVTVTPQVFEVIFTPRRSTRFLRRFVG